VNPKGDSSNLESSVRRYPESEGALDRIEKALALVNRDGLGLEIGPSHNPIAPKSQGFNVHVLDYLSAAELREKFKDDDVDLDRIEEVDFVGHGKPLPELVGGEHCYDWLIASHVIEHIPDPVSFLIGCEQVLRPDGVVSLIVPDKRYCFDHFRPLSTTGELLDAFEQKRTRPSAGSVFDYTVDAVDQDGRIAWSAHDSGEFAPLFTFDEARRRWERARQSNDYLDAHIWRFVPESFRLIVQDLQKLGLTNLRITKDFGTTGHEFHVTLAKGRPHHGIVERLRVLSQLDRDPSTTPRSTLTDHFQRQTAGITMEISEREQKLLAFKRRAFETLRATGKRRTRI
jgi:SAM-dependent methyltransferase